MFDIIGKRRFGYLLSAILVSTGAEETPEGVYLYGDQGIKRTLFVRLDIVDKASLVKAGADLGYPEAVAQLPWAAIGRWPPERAQWLFQNSQTDSPSRQGLSARQSGQA